MTAKKYAILLSVTVLLSLAAPAFATAGSDEMTVDVSQHDGVVVTVTANGTAVQNASVSVSTVDNATYAGAGSHTTDENGTVALPTPANDTTVRLVATKGNESVEATTTLVASENASEDTFGLQVSAFVDSVLSDGSISHPGRVISTWVTAHNPGASKKADHATEGDHGKKHDDDEKHGNDTEHRQDENHGNDAEHGAQNDHSNSHAKGQKNKKDKQDQQEDDHSNGRAKKQHDDDDQNDD